MAGKGKLTDEDRDLWDRVRKSVRPLRPDTATPDLAATAGPAASSTAEPEQKAPRPGERESKQSPPAPTAAPYVPPVSVARSKPPSGPPALSALEPRQKRRLARGSSDVDDRLDLHGMRQATAFHTLAGFLRRAQSRRLKTVLVITGKGTAGGLTGNDGEPGVLRRLVPQWLAREEFRDLVVGFEPAARRHGGAGALYVRIRRQK